MSDNTKPFDDALPGELDVARLYAQSTVVEPGAHVDSAVLRSAREAVAPKAAPFTHNWYTRLSWAAVIVVSVTVVTLQQNQEQLPNTQPNIEETPGGAALESVKDEFRQLPAASAVPGREQASGTGPQPVGPAESVGRSALRKRKNQPKLEVPASPAGEVMSVEKQDSAERKKRNLQVAPLSEPAAANKAAEMLFDVDVAPLQTPAQVGSSAASEAAPEAGVNRRSEQRADLKTRDRAVISSAPTATQTFSYDEELAETEGDNDNRPPADAWLQQIKRMLQQGEHEEAARLLLSFRQHFPHYPESQLRDQLSVESGAPALPGAAEPAP